MILPESLERDLVATTTSTSFDPTVDAAAHLPSGFPGSGGTQSWSSLIGIVTAIVGNILISFALNTQRYAHIRLEREAEERSEAGKKSRDRSRRGSFGAGALAREDADERQHIAESKRITSRRQQRIAERIINDEIYDDHPQESDPLLPRDHAEVSEDSDITIQGDEDDDDELRRGSYLKSPYWWAGIIMMTVGEAGNFLAYGFAPASIVSPLGVVALISNCIVGPLVFKEAFRKRDFLGVVIAVAGAVTVVLSAKTESKKLGPHEIWDAISTLEFKIYFGVTAGLIILLMLLSNKYGGKSVLIDLGLVGLFGGYTALSTKGVASLLSYKLWRLITFPVTYLLAFILIFTAVMQIKYVNRALKRFEATQVIPTQFVMFTLSVILGSAILYRDFERTTAEDAGKFVGGCLMTFLGVWLITSARSNHGDDEGDRDPEPADAIDLRNGERYRDVEENDNTPKASRVRRTSTRSGSQIPGTPQSSLSRAPSVQVVTPNNTSIPSSTPGIVATNPWDEVPYSTTPTPQGPYTSHVPGNTASLSTPELLTNTATSTAPSPSTARPQVHRAPSDLVLNIPQTPAVAQRLLLERADQRNRHSIAGALPAPLLMTSPLSGSLSAMVSELRRANSARGAGTGSPLRQRRSAGLLDGNADEERGLGAGGYGTPVTPGGQRLGLSRTVTGTRSQRSWMGSLRGVSNEEVDNVRSEDAVDSEEQAQQGNGKKRTVRRGRSLSNTLGEMFKGWRREGSVDRRDEDGAGGSVDPERGPSRS